MQRKREKNKDRKTKLKNRDRKKEGYKVGPRKREKQNRLERNRARNLEKSQG